MVPHAARHQWSSRSRGEQKALSGLSTETTAGYWAADGRLSAVPANAEASGLYILASKIEALLVSRTSHPLWHIR